MMPVRAGKPGDYSVSPFLHEMNQAPNRTEQIGSWRCGSSAIKRIVSTLGGSILFLSLVTWQVASGAGLLGGIVIAVDLETRELTLQMPEGHAALFPAAAADVLKDVKVGDRVSIELDQDGKIVKLFKLPVDPGN
ncbi:hypothetical protein [Nitrospira sp. Nam80]